MMAKTGLLILTNPAKIANLLPSVLNHVNNTLYIHWNPHNKVEVKSTEWPNHIQTVNQIYYQVNRYFCYILINLGEIFSRYCNSKPKNNRKILRLISFPLYKT